MSFSDYTLVPADDPQSSPQEDLAAASAGALALSDTIAPVAPDPVIPMGRTWRFDWSSGQFTRTGQSPAPVSGLDAVAEYAQMAIHVARYSCPLVSDAAGMDEPDSVVGEMAVGEALADWQRAIVDAIMVHDRVTSVENIVLDWDPSQGVLTVLSMDIVTDEDESVTVSDITLRAGGS